MSQRSYLAARANTVERGLLAARLMSLLDRDPGSYLTSSEKQDIAEAKDLLKDILTGAETLQKRTCIGGVTAKSIRSLGFALTPLEKLRRVSDAGAPSDDLVVRMLGSMVEVLEEVLRTGSVPAEIDDRDRRQTKDFFAYLADSSLSALSKARRPIRRSPPA